MESRSKLSASTWTREHLYLTITIERACAKCFLYLFLGIDKPPFLQCSIVTLTMDVLEIPAWHNVSQNPSKEGITYNTGGLRDSLRDVDRKFYISSLLAYSTPIVS